MCDIAVSSTLSEHDSDPRCQPRRRQTSAQPNQIPAAARPGGIHFRRGVDTGETMTAPMGPDSSKPGVLRVCLVSDPDLPSEIAGRLAEELPELLRQRLSPATTWEVRQVTAALQADEQVGIAELTLAIGDMMPDQDFDVLVFITDLPRRSGRRPIAAELDAAGRLAIVSIPTMGFVGMYRRIRDAVVRLIAELIVSDHRPAAGVKRMRLRSVSAQPLPAADGGPSAGLRLVGSRWPGWCGPIDRGDCSSVCLVRLRGCLRRLRSP
jgi:hypothetical protein